MSNFHLFYDDDHFVLYKHVYADFIVLDHLKNSLQVDMSLHSDIFFPIPNQPVFALIPVLSGFDLIFGV